MKNHSIQQEILLLPGSSFLQQKRAQIQNQSVKYFGRSFSEEIEKACLTGSIYQMIPEIILQSTSNEKLFLLQARCEKEFLEMELGEDYFKKIDRSFSISPSHFFTNDRNN